METWETRLYEYVRGINRAMLECSADPLLSLIEDPNFSSLLQSRLKRMGESHQKRKVQPVRAMVRLKVIPLIKEEHQVRVKLRMHRTRIFQNGKGSYAEETVETEQLILQKKGGIWSVTGILPDIPEKKPFPKFHVLPETDKGEGGLKMINGEMTFSAFQNSSSPFAESDASSRTVFYDRERAKAYADQWWNGINPEFPHFHVDCTNYVSQCIFAGGAPMHYTGKRASGWWCKKTSGKAFDWSYSWSVSNGLETYLRTSRKGLRASQVHHPAMLKTGDVIFYDWDGDGAFGHSTIVTGFDPDGMPLVNAHTNNARRRYWDYRDSYAWTPKTRYRFYHIADRFT